MYRSNINKARIIELFNIMVENSEILPLIREKHEVAELFSQQLFDTENRSLEISIGFDSDATCFLKGYADIKGFSGFGEGWFNESDVVSFVNDLSDRKFPVSIEGGYYGKDHNLKHINFGLRFTAIGSNGTYRLHIVLKNHPGTGCDPEEIMCFSSQLILDERELDHVVIGFKAMINGGERTLIVTGR